MSNILKIYLDQGSAVVDESGNTNGEKNRVKRSQSSQTITWKLTSNAYKGSIKSFAWKPPYAPAGTFGPPALTPHKKRLNMSDLNNSASTKGDWKYQLKIDVEGTTYTVVASTSTSATLAVTNPIIRNN